MWEMQTLRPQSRPPEVESLREGPRNLYFNEISRSCLNTLKLETGLGHWFFTQDTPQTHWGGMRASSLGKHRGPHPGLLKQGV